MRLTYNTVVYGSEPIAVGIARLARFGYDGVELAGEPERFDAIEIRDLLETHGLEAASISGMFTRDRDLVHQEAEVRANARAYMRSCVDLARAVGAGVVAVSPTAVMRTEPGPDRSQDWAWAVDGLRQVGHYAGEYGVRLAVEPWNRYENFMINRVEQAIELVELVDVPSVGCMADTFHMNIEESDPVAALRSAGDRLFHVQVADNTRQAPGRGNIDFEPIVGVLIELGYEGYVSFELFPAEADPLAAVERGSAGDFFDLYTDESIRNFKRILSKLTS